MDEIAQLRRVYFRNVRQAIMLPGVQTQRPGSCDRSQRCVRPPLCGRSTAEAKRSVSLHAPAVPHLNLLCAQTEHDLSQCKSSAAFLISGLLQFCSSDTTPCACLEPWTYHAVCIRFVTVTAVLVLLDDVPSQKKKMEFILQYNGNIIPRSGIIMLI